MDRNEILELKEKDLLKIINENYGIVLNNLIDKEQLSEVWPIVENLMEEGWRIDIQAKKDYIVIDGILIIEGSPVTLFARYGDVPKFKSVTEGICKVVLIISQES